MLFSVCCLPNTAQCGNCHSFPPTLFGSTVGGNWQQTKNTVAKSFWCSEEGFRFRLLLKWKVRIWCCCCPNFKPHLHTHVITCCVPSTAVVQLLNWPGFTIVITMVVGSGNSFGGRVRVCLSVSQSFCLSIIVSVVVVMIIINAENCKGAPATTAVQWTEHRTNVLKSRTHTHCGALICI